MSTEYTHKDLYNSGNEIKNYLGTYNPEKFWHDYGDFYIKSFMGDEKKSSSLNINMQVLVSRLHEIKPQKVLEVGCGFGRCLPFITRNVPSVTRLVGIEFSKPMLEQKEQFFKLCDTIHRREIIETLQGDARNIPFSDNEFDLVYTHVCLTHIPPKYIPQVTSEISRVAKNWIIHIERLVFPHEHSLQHRWSHLLVPYYLDLGWEVHENDIANKDHHTNVLVLKRGDYK